MNKQIVTHLSENAYENLYSRPAEKLILIMQFLELRIHKNADKEFNKAVLSNGFFKAEVFIHPTIQEAFIKEINPNDILEVSMTKRSGQDLMLVSEFIRLYSGLNQIVGKPVDFIVGIKNPQGSTLISEINKNPALKTLAGVDVIENSHPVRNVYKMESEDEQDQGQFAEFTNLSQYDKSIRVKGRIVKKGDLRHFKTKDGRESSLFNFVLFDGIVEIQGTFFGEQAKNWYSTLEEGKVYSISDADVKAGDKFNMTKFRYVLTFGRNCQVKKLKDNHEIEMVHFNLSSIKDIQDLENGKLIDVMGIVQELGLLAPFTLKTGEKKDRRTITIFDDTNFSINFTLWGDLATNPNFVKNDIIVLKDVSVKDYMGKTVNFGFNSKIITDIPDHPRYRDLVVFLTSNKQLTPTPSSQTAPTNLKLYRINQVNKDTQYLDLNDARRPYYSVVAYVGRIMGNLYYESCPEENCLKKVEKNDKGDFYCQKCSKYFAVSRPRFICNIRIIDDSGNLMISVSGDDNCQVLFGKTIEEIQKIKNNEEEFSDFVTEHLFEEFRFSMSAKKETYNDEEKIKYYCNRVTVVENNIGGFLKNIQSVLNLE